MRPRNAVRGTSRGKAFFFISAVLALAGAVAATIATAFSIMPAGIARLDAARPLIPGRPVQVRSVGLDHMGGDLRRAVKVTRRKHRDRAAQRQSWAGFAFVITRQAVPAAAAF